MQRVRPNNCSRWANQPQNFIIKIQMSIALPWIINIQSGNGLGGQPVRSRPPSSEVQLLESKAPSFWPRLPSVYHQSQAYRWSLFSRYIFLKSARWTHTHPRKGMPDLALASSPCSLFLQALECAARSSLVTSLSVLRILCQRLIGVQ